MTTNKQNQKQEPAGQLSNLRRISRLTQRRTYDRVAEIMIDLSRVIGEEDAVLNHFHISEDEKQLKEFRKRVPKKLPHRPLKGYRYLTYSHEMSPREHLERLMTPTSSSQVRPHIVIIHDVKVIPYSVVRSFAEEHADTLFLFITNIHADDVEAGILDIKTRRFNPHKIVFQRGGFFIARGIWDNKSYKYACRWQEEDGPGYPNAFGRPQWMLLNIETSEVEEVSNTLGEEFLQLQLRKTPRVIRAGCAIRLKDRSDWYMLCHVQGGGRTGFACGLGKSGDFPVELDEVEEVREFEEPTLLNRWHGDDHCLWMDHRGRIFTTYPASRGDLVGKDVNPPGVYLMHEIIPTLTTPFGVDEKVHNPRWVPATDFHYLAYTYQLHRLVLLKRFTKEECDEANSGPEGARLLDDLEYPFLDSLDFKTLASRIDKEMSVKFLEEVMDAHSMESYPREIGDIILEYAHYHTLK